MRKVSMRSVVLATAVAAGSLSMVACTATKPETSSAQRADSRRLSSMPSSSPVIESGLVSAFPSLSPLDVSGADGADGAGDDGDAGDEGDDGGADGAEAASTARRCAALARARA